MKDWKRHEKMIELRAVIKCCQNAMDHYDQQHETARLHGFENNAAFFRQEFYRFRDLIKGYEKEIEQLTPAPAAGKGELG